MKTFKFLQSEGKQTFQFEITNDIRRHGAIHWSSEFSDVVRRWVSDLYFENIWMYPSNWFRYFYTIDRTCEMMEPPKIISRQQGLCDLFSVKIKIWGTNQNWMIAELTYPIDYIIYR